MGLAIRQMCLPLAPPGRSRVFRWTNAIIYLVNERAVNSFLDPTHTNLAAALKRYRILMVSLAASQQLQVRIESVAPYRKGQLLLRLDKPHLVAMRFARVWQQQAFLCK